MTLLSYVLAFLVAIGVLVAVHEYGHFWMARRVGIRVLRFSIGFGKTLWSRRGADGTEYALSAIPLGGYVKLLDEREGPVDPAEVSAAYNRKPVWQRILVLVAGPLANFLFAVAALTLQANQVASGLALSIFGVGLSAFIGKPYESMTLSAVAPASRRYSTWTGMSTRSALRRVPSA